MSIDEIVGKNFSGVISLDEATMIC